MPKQTIADKCRQHGITRDIWDSAKTIGINVWNDAEMTAYLAKRRPRVSKSAKLPESSDDLPDPTEQTIEEIERLIKCSTSYDEIKIYKAKLDGLKVAVTVRTATRDLIPIGEVRQAATRVVSAARAEFLKLTADLPPRLEGLTASKCQKILREAVTAILARLADETSELYKEENE